MLSKRGLLSLLLGGGVLGTSLMLFAQEAAILPKARFNLTVEAVTDMPMRKRPPSPGYVFITAPGNIVGFIKTGEKVKIGGKKVIHTFFGDDVWVKVKRMEQEKKPEGWVYFGSGETSPYFQSAPQGD